MTTTKQSVRTGLAVSAAAAALAAGIVGAGTAAGAATSPTESFLITGSATEAHFVVSGAFAGGGVDVARNSSDILKFGNGRLVVRHPDMDSSFTFHLDPATCEATFRGTGTYTLLNGTGAYARVTGSGTYKYVGRAIAQRAADGSCRGDVEPKVEVFYVRGSGPVTLAPQA